MPFGTWRSQGRFRELKYKRILLLAFCLSALAQTGCGLVPFGSDNKSETAQTTRASGAANPQATTQKDNVGSLDPRDLANPPAPADGITIDPPEPLLATGGMTGPPDALAQAGKFEPRPGGMLGSLGLNLDSYFAEDIQDPMTRIKRLERALSAIQGDLKTVAPPIQRLVAVESDIQELVGQLEVLLENESVSNEPLYVPPPPPAAASLPQPGASAPVPAAAAPVQLQAEMDAEYTPLAPAQPQQPPRQPSPYEQPAASPQPAPATEQPYTPPAYITGGTAAGANITGIRVGEHADKIRIVLDASADTAFRADLDNNEKILVIELPDANWSTVREMTYGKTPILQSYRVESGSGGKGSMLIMQLKSNSTIVYQKKLDAISGTGKRIIVDLAR